MASTLKAERNAVRARLNDLNFGNAILQADLVDAAVQDVYLMMVAEGLGERLWETGYITCAPGSVQYSMPNAEEQADFIALRIGQVVPGNGGRQLDRITPTEMSDWQRDMSQTPGIPTMFSLLDGGGNTQLFIWPPPDSTITELDALHDIFITPFVLDTQQLSLSQAGLAALRDLAASRIPLGPKMLEKLDLAPDVQSRMAASGERMLQDEKIRIARHARVSNVSQVMA